MKFINIKECSYYKWYESDFKNNTWPVYYFIKYVDSGGFVASCFEFHLTICDDAHIEIQFDTSHDWLGFKNAMDEVTEITKEEFEDAFNEYLSDIKSSFNLN